MPDVDKRPWWKKRRTWGYILGGISATLVAVPAAPVLFTIGSVSVTTTVLAIPISQLATLVFGYGKGHKDAREAK